MKNGAKGLGARLLSGVGLALVLAVGLPSHSRGEMSIHGGDPAEEGSIPWQASVFWSDQDPFKGHYCGAAILSEQWVVTNAHCIRPQEGRRVRPRKIYVFSGSVDLLSTSEAGDSLITEVVKIVKHPDYPRDPNSDVALLKLGQRLRWTKGRQPIELVTNDEAMASPGTWAVLSGWGENQNLEKLPELYKVDVPIISNDECQQRWRDHEAVISEEAVCTFLPGSGNCFGDSGGPLAVPTGDGDHRLAAVTARTPSVGNARCHKQLPDIHIRMSKFASWIHDTIGKSER